MDGDVDGLVAFVALNTNRHARFVHDRQEIPIRRGTLVVFPGNVEHQTVVESGEVQLLGPFTLKDLRPVSIRGCFSERDTVLVKGRDWSG